MHSTLFLIFFLLSFLPSFLATFLIPYFSVFFSFSSISIPLSFPPSVNNGCSIKATDMLIDHIIPKVLNIVSSSSPLYFSPLLPPQDPYSGPG